LISSDYWDCTVCSEKYATLSIYSIFESRSRLIMSRIVWIVFKASFSKIDLPSCSLATPPGTTLLRNWMAT